MDAINVPTNIPLSAIADLVIIPNAGVPTDAVTGANIAGKGSLVIDTTNGKLYINGGTKSSPTWKLVTSA